MSVLPETTVRYFATLVSEYWLRRCVTLVDLVLVLLGNVRAHAARGCTARAACARVPVLVLIVLLVLMMLVFLVLGDARARCCADLNHMHMS